MAELQDSGNSKLLVPDKLDTHATHPFQQMVGAGPSAEASTGQTRARSHSLASNFSDTVKEVPLKEEPKVEPPLQIGFNILLMLFVLGMTTAAVDGCCIWVGKLISLSQTKLINSSVVGPLLYIIAASGYVAASAYAVKWGKTSATIGPGIPEIKALLANDFHRSDFPSIVSFKISCVRMFSIVTAVGAGLSLGIAAPLAHCSICTAYTLMNLIPDFAEFLENHQIRKQIFTAAAAVGFTTSFNTPLGGLLLCIELTSTFYLVSNYWRSFMVVVVGGIICSAMLIARKDPVRMYQVPYIEAPYVEWEYLTFGLLGALCGVLDLLYLKLHRAVAAYVKPYTLKHPVATAAVAGGTTALLIYAIGAYSADGVTETIVVHDLFLDAHVSEMKSRPGVNGLGALFASLIVHVVLAQLGTQIRISSGILLPVLTLGALLGRIFGQILSYMCGSGANIYLGGYAMVGAVAFMAGASHTVSIAVIVIEQTGQLSMLMPCLIGAVVACGITKSRSLSLYDQGMVNKGIESFDLLLKESGGFKYAADVLDEEVTSVHALCTVNDLFELLGPSVKQSTFPVTSSARSYRLVGCLDRKDVYAYLKAIFDREGLYAYVRQRLPADAHYDDRRNARMKQIQQRRALFNAQSIFALNRGSPGSPSGDFDDDGTPVSPSKGWLGTLNRPRWRQYRRTQGDESEDDADDDAEYFEDDDEGYGDSDVITWDNDGTRKGVAVVNPLLLRAAAAEAVVVVPESLKESEVNGHPSVAAPSGEATESPLRNLKPSWSFQAPPSESLQNLAEGLKENLRTLQSRVAQLPAEMGLPVSVDPTAAKAVEFTPEQQAKIDQILGRTINLTQEAALTINGFPFTAHRYTTMDQLYVLFEMVKVNVVFVVSNTKRLEGMITKHRLMQSLKKKMK